MKVSSVQLVQFMSQLHSSPVIHKKIEMSSSEPEQHVRSSQHRLHHPPSRVGKECMGNEWKCIHSSGTYSVECGCSMWSSTAFQWSCMFFSIVTSEMPTTPGVDVEKSSSSLSIVGPIIGAVIGGVVLLLVVIIAIQIFNPPTQNQERVRYNREWRSIGHVSCG